VTPPTNGHPTAPPSETAVIGRALVRPEEAPQIVAALTAESFTSGLAAQAFGVIAECVGDGRSPDVSMLASIGLTRDELAVVADWAGYGADARAIDWHIDRVQDAHTRRRLRGFAAQAAQAAETAETAGEAIDETSVALAALARDTDRGGRARTMAAVLEEVVRDAIEPAGATPQRVDTGVWALDDTSHGLPRHGLVIVAGRPSMGKTSAATELARSIATIHGGAPVAFFSVEMSADQIGTAMVSAASGVPKSMLEPRGGKAIQLTDEHVGRLLMHQAQLATLPIHVYDDPRVSPLDIRARCSRLLHETRAPKMAAVVVDFAQILDLSAGERKGGREDQALSWAARELKILSRDLECPVILVSQINREVERRTDQRPRMSDLKGSGGLEEAADVVIFCYRPSYYDQESEEPDEWIVGKNRGGPTGTARMRFVGERVRWDSGGW